MAASIKKIMEASSAYNFFTSTKILIKFATNWFDRQIHSFKAHQLYGEGFPLI